ncbi:phosphoenolpyruvate synthase [Spirosoma daeguense]
MSTYVLDFQEVGKTKLGLVGGKGANLGELTRVNGIHVPDGFCISTEAFKRVVGNVALVNELLDTLSTLQVQDRTKITELSARIRNAIEATAIPDYIRAEVIRHIVSLGEKDAYAVRSSATAEDLPTASFAGQQDTYLNVIGIEAIITHIRKCWASLFTERAIVYRLQNGFDHRSVHLAVVVQKMVFPQAAGILFTADPVTSDRNVVSIDASFGLGEAMVSGLVNPDVYKVRNEAIIDRKIAAKKLAVYALETGGTNEQEIEPEQQNQPALTDAQILALSQTGREIEAHFGSPQDIEWCVADERIYIVQSRPITTLFPIPEANDSENHVYVSVGHQQMMTDPMKPLGLAFWLLIAPPTMRTAGGRLFVDVTAMLESAASRQQVMATLGKSDPLIKDALTTVVERGDFLKSFPEDTENPASGKGSHVLPTADKTNPADLPPTIVSDLIQKSERALEATKQAIRSKSGTELLDFILDDIQQLKKILFDPKSLQLIMIAIDASAWINEKMMEWLGEKNAADTLAQSVPDNITSEMGLALLDVADVIRPFPEVITYLQHIQSDTFLDDLVKVDGGPEARKAIDDFLTKYGMRCVGEIDITRTRWAEKPTTLIPLILSNVRNAEPGASKRKFEQGRQEALAKEQDLLVRLKQLPDGEQKTKETAQKIALIRNFAGYREYPKYDKISRYYVYKQALLKEAERLVKNGVIPEKEAIYYLTFNELRDVVRTHQLDYDLIRQRKDAYKFYEKLTPPRVITSDGEIITGTYKRDNIPAEAIVGLAVSSGIIEGRARVILNMEEANLEEGDILVTAFTDPSWTPLFVSIKGLVTEVGGLMTHGAVIAREYGLPAVVGVENATKLIKDGQRIRVNGTDGWIEVID